MTKKKKYAHSASKSHGIDLLIRYSLLSVRTEDNSLGTADIDLTAGRNLLLYFLLFI